MEQIVTHLTPTKKHKNNQTNSLNFYDKRKSKQLLNSLDDYDTFRSLLETNANPDHHLGHLNKTILHTTHDHIIVSLLLDAKADPNALRKDGVTPLHTCQDYECVKLLLNAHADPNIKDKSGNTPLHKVHNTDILQLLINYNGNPNIINNKNMTSLHTACNHDILKILIDNNGICDMRTLQIHLYNKYSVEYILNHTSATTMAMTTNKDDNNNTNSSDNSNDTDNTDSNTTTHKNINFTLQDRFYPLLLINNEGVYHYMLRLYQVSPEHYTNRIELNDTDRLDVVDMLLSTYTNQDELNFVLHQAHNGDIVKSLCKANADVNNRDIRGKTPLLSDVISFDSIKALIECKADIAACDDHNHENVLFHINQLDQFKYIVECSKSQLISQPDDDDDDYHFLNSKNTSHRTPLYSKNYNIILYLLTYYYNEIDINNIDRDGKPYYYGYLSYRDWSIPNDEILTILYILSPINILIPRGNDCLLVRFMETPAGRHNLYSILEYGSQYPFDEPPEYDDSLVLDSLGWQ